MHARRPLHSEDVYRWRLLASTAGVLLLLLLLVRGWPAPSPSTTDQPFHDRPADRIQIEEIRPTSQSREQKPPPPAPLPPVVVPNDAIVEQTFKIGEAELRVETPEDDPTRQEGQSTPATATRQPDTGARLLRNVQPRYPAAAQDKDVRARVRVEVKVSESGRVQEARIIERWRISETGTVRPVAALGHGLDQAALAAARSSLFRPARHNGEPVSTRTTITFTFGP